MREIKFRAWHKEEKNTTMTFNMPMTMERGKTPMMLKQFPKLALAIC